MLITAGILLLLFAASAGFLVWRTRNENEGADKASARAHAESACGHAARFDDLAKANAGAGEVRGELRAAERDARIAAEADPAWLPLHGGLSALDLAFDHDDPMAARVGIDVVRVQCKALRAGP